MVLYAVLTEELNRGSLDNVEGAYNMKTNIIMELGDKGFPVASSQQDLGAAQSKTIKGAWSGY